ncbi:hypothetical protein EC968_006857 [Mortierella alpina]|nr:hypothetical protein EC968_006857 [Mortierella alpina]
MAKAGYMVESTSQFAPVDTQDVFRGWSTTVRYGANVVDAITLKINDTQNIPHAIPGRTYIPRRSEFEIACEHFDIVVLDPAEPQLHLTHGGCATLTVAFDDEYKFMNTTVIQRMDNRWDITVPRSSTPLSINNAPVQLNSSRADMPYCAITTHEIFDDKADELLHSIRASIRSKVRFNVSERHPTLDTAMLMEISIADRAVDAVICEVETVVLRHAAPALECLYVNINTFITKAQTANPDIIEARKDGSNYTNPIGTISTAVVIEHIPNRVNGIQAPGPILGIRNDTYNVSQFIAAMGQNILHRLL